MDNGTKQMERATMTLGRTRLLAFAAMLCLTLLGVAAVDAAQQPPEPPAGFVPADSLPSQEQLPAAPLVISAYAIAWVAVFGYLWSIWRRLNRVERELVDVSRRIAAGERR
jgi:CcmD family protein